MTPITEQPIVVPDFAQGIATRTAKVGIVGLGYAGLPLAIAFAEAGFEVVGLDLDEGRVASVEGRRSYLVDVPEERYAATDGRLRATTDYAAVAQLDAITICVPTPLTPHRSPNLRFVQSAIDGIAEHLKPGALVVLQSTTYPGTTERIIVPALEREGRVVGEDFFVGYAPERVDPGNARFSLRNTPKIVSGVTDECRARTAALYGTIVDDLVPVSGTTTAELVKLHENTFRQVNIALANELALMCDKLGVSPWEVIDAAATKPFGFLPHYPGPGLGGDCIPVVPHFLTWRMREHGYATRLVEAAHAVNAEMPRHVVAKVTDALNDDGRSVKGARILLLGMAYKPNVHDTRESPAVEVMRDLAARGGDVRYCDPWVDFVDVAGAAFPSVEWSAEQVDSADCVVMLTPHRQFIETPLWAEARVMVDACNVVPPGEGVWRI